MHLHPFRVLQMDTLRSKLEEAQADNQNLRFEGKMVMMNVAQWTDQMYATCRCDISRANAFAVLLSDPGTNPQCFFFPLIIRF